MAVAHPNRYMGGSLAEAQSAAVAGQPASEGGLLVVGAFKLLKALFFIAIGLGALHLVHRNFGDLVMHLVDSLPIDPEGRIVSMVMDKADLINGHDLRRIGAGAIIYAMLCLIEGTGLLLRKGWAEYFTLILTTLGLPLELFELVRHATLFRAGALAINLLILLYLGWVLKQRQPQELAARARI